jgi:hypothetical protein
MILITESKSCKIGWTVRARFQIRLHSNELLLLKEIQSFFGGIGDIYLSSKDQSVTYRIEDIKSITSTIIPHFDEFPLESAKRIDYELWKECLLLMINKDHLTQAGFEKIISIKGVINKGLPDKLKNAFPSVEVLTRPKFIVSKDKLNPYWVSGFTAGDGCFTFQITPKYATAIYQIGLHNRDEPLLLKIKEFFNSKGNISSSGKRTSAVYRINAKLDLNTVIIPHFYKYSLSGVKLHNYIIWCKMLELVTNKAHLTQDGLVKLKQLKSTLNKI